MSKLLPQIKSVNSQTLQYDYQRTLCCTCHIKKKITCEDSKICYKTTISE